jgi:deazaflavin-dependent oxidoreductase (nitroreductase family)
MTADNQDRLQKIATRQTLTLTHYGRKTGKAYEVTIWFIVEGDKIYLATANKNRQWVRNVQKTPAVKLSIGGEGFEGTAGFITDRAEHERVLGMVQRKYWMVLPLLVTGRILMSLHWIKDNTGSFEVRLAA